MAKLKVYDAKGDLTSSTVEVDDAVFSAEGGEHLLYEAVTFHLANRRQGTHKTKERAEVRGGGRKPWRQKGTGRSRAGSIRSPLWKGGGVTFGPRPRDYRKKLPARAHRRARIAALSVKTGEEAVFATEAVRPGEPKTRIMAELLEKMELGEKKVLWLVAESDENLRLASRNLTGCRTLLATHASVYDILNSDVVLIEKDAIAPLQEILTR
ncbi:MAG: 50S ribosomal protein L4 [bacterium]